MKKLISFLLVIMMLCSMSVSAFAEVLEYGVSKDGTAFDADKGTGNTEVWLQVEASGQIDVTVPLVVVFRTDIDGGDADTATNYGLTNNTYATLAVTNIAVSNVETTNTSLVAYNKVSKDNDEYGVQFYVNDNANWDAFDLSETAASGNQKVALFQLTPVDKSTDTAKQTDVTVKMDTGKFSFVTARTQSDDGKSDTLNEGMGLKLLTVTYTVAVDTSTIVESEALSDTVTWYS